MSFCLCGRVENGPQAHQVYTQSMRQSSLSYGLSGSSFFPVLVKKQHFGAIITLRAQSGPVGSTSQRWPRCSAPTTHNVYATQTHPGAPGLGLAPTAGPDPSAAPVQLAGQSVQALGCVPHLPVAQCGPTCGSAPTSPPQSHAPYMHILVFVPGVQSTARPLPSDSPGSWVPQAVLLAWP